MIDFIKIHLINTNLEHIETHHLLDFILEVNSNTGEPKPIKKATYKGLTFKIYDRTEKTLNKRLTIEGSLHIFWNDGLHNFNDFGYYEVIQVLKDLKTLFNINTCNCVLRQLEIGVNIHPPMKTELILNSCIMSKTTELKSIYTKEEGSYIQGRNQRHIVKIYDKRTHYVKKGFTIEKETMRIEKKWCKMIEINNKGIFTLEDLIKHGLHRFKDDLTKMWIDVLFCDLNTVKDSKYDNKYNNINWWRQQSYERFKYHRRNLNNLIKSDNKNIKNQIEALIIEKVNFLTQNTRN